MNTEQTFWYVSKNNEKFGPYSYNEMIALIQENNLNKENYVWSQHLDSWIPLYQVNEFKETKLATLSQLVEKNQLGFKDRKYKRKEVSIPIIGHNNKTFFCGLIQSISEKGGLFYINTNYLTKTDLVKIHIDDKDPFNIEGVVKNKLMHHQESARTSVHQPYIIEFNEISDEGKNLIQQVVNN